MVVTDGVSVLKEMKHFGVVSLQLKRQPAVFFFKGGRCGFMSQNEEFIFGTELVFVHFLIFNR